MTNQANNNNKKPVSFDNLRSLNQINNAELSKLNNMAERMLTQVETIAKDIRNNLRKLKEGNENQKVETNVRPTERHTSKNTPKIQQRVFNADGKPGFNKKPAKPFDNNDRRKPTNNNNPHQNTQNNKPRQQKSDSADRSVTPAFIPTAKRGFDKKKDERKDKNYEREGKSKKSLMRRGLIEENNITERIRSNRKIKKKAKEEPVVIASPIEHAIITTANITVKQLSEKTGRSVAEILKQLMVLGIMSNLNSSIDFTTAELVCSELGVVLEQKLEKTYEEKLADEFMNQDDDADSADNIKRSPIVTILGHVDHGKTSLLDYIRKSHIASGEAGGITQHISAYQIEKNGEPITFIDTPGHEAFSAMRARGASVTDIAILVVAADDGVKPQTKEAIKHIKEAKVPMLVAINKIDKPEANIDRVKEQLAKEDVIPEEWGGDAIIVPISALTGQGVDKLLEMIILMADMQELKANPKRHALGMVIEAKLDKGKGPIATLIILNGTLKVGDTIISGTHVGKVRAILDDKGKNIKSAPPSKPVSILGLDGVPNAGDQLYVVDEKMSKNVLAERKRKQQTDLINAKSKMSVEEFLAKNIEDEKKVLYLIVKTDVQGSFEALTAILNEINNEEVRVECIHGGVGAITENDVLLAKSSGALLVAFNVKPDSKANALAEHDKIEILQSKIIYQITEEVSRRIKAMRAPVFEERVIGHCEVIRVFKISRIGTVAGCICKDGKINKNVKIRLFREGKQLVETTITTLQKDKMDVKEVSAGMECGIKLDGHNDIILGDILEAFVMEQIERD